MSPQSPPILSLLPPPFIPAACIVYVTTRIIRHVPTTASPSNWERSPSSGAALAYCICEHPAVALPHKFRPPAKRNQKNIACEKRPQEDDVHTTDGGWTNTTTLNFHPSASSGRHNACVAWGKLCRRGGSSHSATKLEHPSSLSVSLSSPPARRKASLAEHRILVKPRLYTTRNHRAAAAAAQQKRLPP